MEVDDSGRPDETTLPLRSPRPQKTLQSPQRSQSPTPTPQLTSSSSSPEVTLVAAAELHENQRWKPTTLHPGPAYKKIEWSADGTTVITSSASKTILSYVLPNDLLDPRKDDDNSHRTLTCHGRLRFGITPSAFAPAPYFSLAEPWSQTVLVGFRDRPIQLYPLFPGDKDEDDDDSDLYTKPTTPLASYSLIKHETEAYLPPMSLLWTAPGNHLVVGTKSLLALFDASRTSNDPPLLKVPTFSQTGGGFSLGLRGTVSALAAGAGASQNLTAAGTWTRGVGLYDLTRAGACTANWKVSSDSAEAGGDGIVQTLWSPCGRYLVVNERKSRGLLVYDVRGAGKLLCTLIGRSAHASQPIRATVYESATGTTPGFELWSGTDSGAVVMYEGIGSREGLIDPTWQWQAHGQAMVGGTAMHASGSVLATCASSPPIPDDGEGSESESNSDDSSDSDSEDNDDSSDDSEAPSTSSGSSRLARSGATVSDPSIKIWSLVPLKPYEDEEK
ncbi:hypothetical protein Sste5346_009797 [Sporothrix stenoceras]|uniref:WD repeat-containing protein n=1 Tax=Sporothrix stenoceras TaxID=5173 RepID=A0ABR3YJA3_9PEZI